MLFKSLITASLACSFCLCTNFALAQAAWTKFIDPTKEITVSLPNPVKAGKTPAGGDQYEASEGTVTYKLAFRRRSTLPAEREEEIFCTTFANGFAKVMAENGTPVNFLPAGQATGKNWKGRIYRYESAKGFSGALEIAIAEHHNFILHVMGAPLTAEKTQRFFKSFEVN